jgi:hypothetical protein
MSPSQNLGCGILDDAVGASADAPPGLWGCEAKSHVWKFPAEKEGDVCYQAPIPCGNGIEAIGSAMPGAGLRSDIAFASELGTTDLSGRPFASRVLQYGESVSYRGVTCTSAPDGIRCENTRSGHGFWISQTRNELH